MPVYLTWINNVGTRYAFQLSLENEQSRFYTNSSTVGHLWYATNIDGLLIPINESCDVYNATSESPVALIAFGTD